MFLLFVWLAVCSTGLHAQCVDEMGDVRDWFLMMKMPNGYDYLYADDTTPGLVEGKYQLVVDNNPAARVLKSVYKNPNTNYIMYNDQVPHGGAVVNRGHTKGVLQWDLNTVTWIVHSVPNFPPAALNQTSHYSYPSSARTYGQTLLCVSTDVDHLEDLANQLLYTWPKVYSSRVTANWIEKIPTLGRIISGKHIHIPPWTSVAAVKTGHLGTEFTCFAKTKEFNGDIYSELVSGYLESSLFTETWQKGPGRLASNCSSPYHVLNVRSMELLGNKYSEFQDHSKWAVSGKDEMVCVGGVNRMYSQFKRGGGTVCFRNQQIWQQLRNAITDFEDCAEGSDVKNLF